MADMPVHEMMGKLQHSYPKSCDELVDMLGIYLNCIMNKLSVSHRKRVKIMIGLIRPFKLVLLNEITTPIYVCVKKDLLHWILKYTNERGETIIYTTHIFDGIYERVAHLHYPIDEVKCGWKGKIQDM